MNLLLQRTLTTRKQTNKYLNGCMGITEQLFEKTMAKDSLLSTIFIYTTEVINASIMLLYHKNVIVQLSQIKAKTRQVFFSYVISFTKG